MKHINRAMIAVIALGLILGACVPAVSAAAPKKIWVSHFNDTESWANESIIFTRSGIGERTLGDLTATEPPGATTADVLYDHRFANYYTLVCAWDNERGAYVVQQLSWEGSDSVGANLAASFSVPDNGFILAVHMDAIVYESHISIEFGRRNLSGMTRGTWRSFEGAEVYLYNIDLEAATRETALQISGLFYSKLSEQGRANGWTEVYESFTTESYVMIGGEDPDAIVSPYRPAHVEVTTTKLKDAVDEAQSLDEYDYTQASWDALQATIAAVDIEKEGLTQEEVDAWRAAVAEATANLLPVGEETPDGTEPGDADPAEDGDNPDETIRNPGKKQTGESGNMTLYIVIGAVALVLLGGTAFLIYALKKRKKAAAQAEKTDNDQAPPSNT